MTSWFPQAIAGPGVPKLFYREQALINAALTFFKSVSGTKTEPFFKAHGGEGADGLHIGNGFCVEKWQMAERHFKFAPAILSRNGNGNDE